MAKTKEKRACHLSVWLTLTERKNIAARAAEEQDAPSAWLRKLALREMAKVRA